MRHIYHGLNHQPPQAPRPFIYDQITESRINWWKLKKEECCTEFREEMRQALGLSGKSYQKTGKVQLKW